MYLPSVRTRVSSLWREASWLVVVVVVGVVGLIRIHLESTVRVREREQRPTTKCRERKEKNNKIYIKHH